MKRISTNMTNDDMQYHLRIREYKMNELQNKMGEQTRVRELRDDPVAAAHSVRYQSHLYRLRRFVENADTVQSNHRVAEAYIDSTNDIIHRVREIAVQGANGTYSTEEKRMMGEEVNQLLNQIIEYANARSGDGTSIFSGDKNQGLPYRVLSANVQGAQGQVVSSVEYTGTIGVKMAEVSEGSYVQANFPGNRIFWAENQQLFSDVEAVQYVVQSDSSILVDGESIDLKAGDNVHAIIAKINDSGSAVRASLDPVQNSLLLETTFPHQLWLEDAAGGTVLTDLGVVSGPGDRPPHNIAPDARLAGGSLFDMIIHLRDRLYHGDTLEIGGSALKGIDNAQSNLLHALAHLGAQDERLDIVRSRLENEIPEVIQKNSNQMDLDMTQAIMDLKMLEYTHKAALQTAGRILQPTLLDYLR